MRQDLYTTTVNGKEVYRSLEKTKEPKSKRLTDDEKNSIYIDFLSGGDNSKKRLAEKFGVTVHQVERAINENFKFRKF